MKGTKSKESLNRAHQHNGYQVTASPDAPKKYLSGRLPDQSLQWLGAGETLADKVVWPGFFLFFKETSTYCLRRFRLLISSDYI